MQIPVIEELLNAMKIVEMPALQDVFEIGSLGDLFYFVIEGVVEIRIPDYENQQQYSLTCNTISYLDSQITSLGMSIKTLK